MTTEFLHLADLHFSNCLPYTTIDPEKGYNKRFDDQVSCFDHACKYAVDHGVKRIIISGDVFHYHNPSSRERTIVAGLLAKWGMRGIEFIIMNGNHDVGGRGWSALGDLQAIGAANITIYCDDKIHYVEIGDCSLVSVPFRKEQTLKEIDDYCNENKLKRDVLMFHDSIIGADYGFGFKSIDGFSIPDLFNLGFNYVAMGHFHKWHHWKQEGRWIVYPGSMISRDFNEFNSQEKYFAHVKLNGSDVKIKRVAYPKINKLYKLHLDTKFNPAKMFCGEKECDSYDTEDLKGAIIKVIYPKTLDNKHKSIDFSRISDDLKSRGASFIILEPDTKQDETEFVDLSTIASNELTLSTLINDYCLANDYDSKTSLNVLEGYLSSEA